MVAARFMCVLWFAVEPGWQQAGDEHHGIDVEVIPPGGSALMVRIEPIVFELLGKGLPAGQVGKERIRRCGQRPGCLLHPGLQEGASMEANGESQFPERKPVVGRVGGLPAVDEVLQAEASPDYS